MEAPGLVVVPAGQLHLMREQLLQQQEQYHHIGLLGHLDLRDLLLVVVLVYPAYMGLFLVLGQVDILECQIGAVLGQDAVLVGLGEKNLFPLLRPFLLETSQPQLLIQRGVQLGFLLLEYSTVLNGLADGPSDQIVGKGVVVHMLLVLVRA